jgi:uridylate kinase
MPHYPIHKTKNKQIVISLGGSLIVPNEVDIKYLTKFRTFILNQLENGWRFFIVTGGGAQARRYIDAGNKITNGEISKEDMDWLGVHSTRFNAHLIRTIFRNEAQPLIVRNPEEDEIKNKKIVVVSGWKPGWSTDFVSGKIAQRINAPYVINLSNIKQVYTDDPRKNPNAKPIEKMNWKDFRKMVGSKWIPGMNSPYDPIAAKLAEKENQTVLVMDGINLKNIEKLLTTGDFEGTVLTND